eukprot:723504-Prorocentrum_lima.AAC.1
MDQFNGCALACPECAHSAAGRGLSAWQALPLPPGARPRLLARGGALLHCVRDRTGTAIEVP